MTHASDDLIEIRLTSEQAQWLEETLYSMERKLAWEPASMVSAALEHTRTVREKVKAAMRKGTWVQP